MDRCPHCATPSPTPPVCRVCGMPADVPPAAPLPVAIEPTLHAPVSVSATRLDGLLATEDELGDVSLPADPELVEMASVCPRCGAPVGASRRCARCGAVGRADDDEGRRLRCFACGAPNRPGAPACAACGQ